ncbi:hypothetical protein K523DRAFT_275473 [Schizophyllum commune Tattone D]|nr:hypothetical protein K525DRAFT_284345 [Schizophyllum commune Loenen D]KAI5828988.1 hypothetical protein K523DRAFT_275473 [Schizophyllum commune Tattone D]
MVASQHGDYVTTYRGTNSQGNKYARKYYFSYGKWAYHYSNSDGSYYYKNPDGSKYHNNGRGTITYTSPSGQVYKRYLN